MGSGIFLDENGVKMCSLRYNIILEYQKKMINLIIETEQLVICFSSFFKTKVQERKRGCCNIFQRSPFLARGTHGQFYNL